MAKSARPAAYDVWFLAADTVYKGVPSDVLVGWAEQGRVSAADKLRPTGSTAEWGRVGADPFFAAFLFRGGQTKPAALEQLEPVEAETVFRLGEEEDDDPDMIPLIDISLVLLIFFMMTSVVSTLSPVDVPDMKHASEPSKDADAISLIIDKRPNDEIYYAVRVGEQPLLAEDNNLPGPDEAMRRVDAKIAVAQRPPEVRIACHKKLPGDRVDELLQELDRRQRDGKILSYGAEVNERK